MSKGIRYSDEFKQEAVNQVVVHGYSVADVAARLDISTKSLYGWMKSFSKPTKQRKEDEDLRAEVARLVLPRLFISPTQTLFTARSRTYLHWL